MSHSRSRHRSRSRYRSHSPNMAMFHKPHRPSRRRSYARSRDSRSRSRSRSRTTHTRRRYRHKYKNKSRHRSRYRSRRSRSSSRSSNCSYSSVKSLQSSNSTHIVIAAIESKSKQETSIIKNNDNNLSETMQMQCLQQELNDFMKDIRDNNVMKLLDVYHIFDDKHMKIFNKIDTSLSIKKTDFEHVIIFGHYLWIRGETIYRKMNFKTSDEWKQFIRSTKPILSQQWLLKSKQYSDNIKDTLDNKLNFVPKSLMNFIETLQLINKFTQRTHQNYISLIPKHSRQYNHPKTPNARNKMPNKWRAKEVNDWRNAIQNSIERRPVSEWNYYSIIYWLNRVNNGQFKGLKYINLREHIVIGKVRGCQLCQINDVTLQMIGIYDQNDIELILSSINELISDDSYNNLMANMLLSDIVPIGYCDPVSFELMNDPVCMESGNVYEREFIEEYISKYNNEPFVQTSICIDEGELPMSFDEGEIINYVSDCKLKERIDMWRNSNLIMSMYDVK
eukprot:542660_1